MGDYTSLDVVKMVNHEHMSLLKSGTDVVNAWRKKNPDKIFDLSEVPLTCFYLGEINLSDAEISQAALYLVNLENADLSRAIGTKIIILLSDFENANLSGIKLSEARIMNSDFKGANFQNAKIVKSELAYNLFLKGDFSNIELNDCVSFENNFSKSNFFKSDLTKNELAFSTFRFSNFSDSDLSASKINGSNFLGCDFSNTNFTDVEIENVTFSSCDLSSCIGMDTMKHLGPSYIDMFTVQSTFLSAENCLTPEFEEFLTLSGFPMKLVQQIPKIIGGIKYNSAFICYGQPDLAYAEKLKKDLVSRGVSCWLYSLDSTVGERTWREITQKRREAEEMIILCSSQSLIREGPLKEIEEEIDENPEKIIPVSLDNIWKQNGFPVRRGHRDLKPFLLERNYADFSLQSLHKQSLDKLLEALKLK